MNPKTYDRETIDSADFLHKTGSLTARVVQIDIAVATKFNSATEGHDRALCDHNCGIEGGYSCPAAIFDPKNRGLKRKDLASVDNLMQAIETGAKGISIFNQRFIDNGSLDKYSEIFQIPDKIKRGIRYCLENDKLLVNIFGGQAEIHPGAVEIGRRSHQKNFLTNLTTTGGILLRQNPESELFLKGLLDGAINTLAITAEFKSGDDIRRLANMTREELLKEWTKIDPHLGQLRKGIETINVLRLKREYGNEFPQPLLNLVVHRGILSQNGNKVEEIIEALKETTEGVKINPYPAQSFRKNQKAELSFTPSDVPALKKFINKRRQEQKNLDPNMALRPHYYDMLEAVLRTFDGQDEAIAKRFSGEEVWTCFKNPYNLSGAGKVVQIGASDHLRDLTKFPSPGLWEACFWDDTVTNSDQQITTMTPQDIANNIDGGMHQRSLLIKNPCRGCLMPRLNGEITELLGMTPILLPAFIEARKETLGF